MKKNNAGISLVEVVVVIAILAILGGGAYYGIGQISGFRAREGADTICSSISQSRIQILGKAKNNQNMAWQLVRKGNEYYVRTAYDLDGTPYYKDEKKIVDGKVTVYTGEKSGASVSTTELADGGVCTIYFNRSTGAACDVSGNTRTANPYISVKHGRKEYHVEVIAKTGKIVSNTVKK